MDSLRNVDWQVGKTVLQSSIFMFENKIATDVCFEVGLPDQSTVDITAHKYALISRSPVFEAMFCGSMIENNCNVNCGAQKIRISDVEPEAFQEALRWIYCETSSITPSNVSSVLYTSKKYMLPQLSAACMSFLEQNLNMENVCSILDQGLLYDELELTNKCLQFIAPNAQSILQTESFLSLSKAAVIKIAQHDYLYLDSEAILYQACIRWARAKLQESRDPRQDATDAEIRQTLGEIVHRIRFPNMKAAEFARDVGRERILTDAEKSTLYYYILTQELPDDKTRLEFDQGLRVQICSRFISIGSALQWWSCNGPTDALSFQTDNEIQLIGIALYGGKEKANHDVMIEIRDSTVETSNEPLVRINSFTFESDGGTTPSAFYLPSVITIKSDHLYTIMVTMKGPLTHYGTTGKDKVTSAGITFQFFSSNKSTNGTNVKSGQIPHFIFKMAAGE